MGVCGGNTELKTVHKSHPREWVDRSNPTYMRALNTASNRTHGSGWIVQVQPVWVKGKAGLEVSSDSRRRDYLRAA
jgi:hypothetical protein